jgi:hypothetical protein
LTSGIQTLGCASVSSPDRVIRGRSQSPARDRPHRLGYPRRRDVTALRAVIAANAHTDRCGSVEVIALTCAEVRHLFTAVILEPARALAGPAACRYGDAAINTAPAPATTSDSRPRGPIRNDLRLGTMRCPVVLGPRSNRIWPGR